MISRGSKEFAKAAEGRRRWWADRLQVEPATITRYIHGQITPKEKKRAEIAEAGGPEAIAWDEPVVAPQERRAAREADPDVKASPEGVQRLADRLQAQAEALEEEIRNSPGEPDEQLRSLEKLASIVSSLGKHTGNTITNERQIMASPAWARLELSIRDALTPWPDAMRAVGEALRDLGAP
jgi:transcriptional regulator with XRE-family HTH domain